MSQPVIPISVQSFGQLENLITPKDCIVPFNTVKAQILKEFHPHLEFPVFSEPGVLRFNRYVFLNITKDPEFIKSYDFLNLLRKRKLKRCECDPEKEIEKPSSKIQLNLNISILSMTLFKNIKYPSHLDVAHLMKSEQEKFCRLSTIVENRAEVVCYLNCLCYPISTTIQLVSRMACCCFSCVPCGDDPYEPCFKEISSKAQICCMPLLQQSPRGSNPRQIYWSHYHTIVMNLFRPINNNRTVLPEERNELFVRAKRIAILTNFQELIPFVEGVQGNTGIVDIFLSFLDCTQRSELGLRYDTTSEKKPAKSRKPN